MRLDACAAAYAALLAGERSPEACARELYGEAPPPLASRLAIYAEHGRDGRRRALGLYSLCREAVLARADEAAWTALVEGYFAGHAMSHCQLWHNGAAFPAHLASLPASPARPEWLAELADLEWRLWRAEEAPDAPSDLRPTEGPLRVTSTLCVRPYRHDLVGWLDRRGDAGGSPDPEARPCVVACWRSAELDACHDALGLGELLVLQAVREGRAPNRAEASSLGLDPEILPEILASLREVGLVLGGEPGRAG